MKNSTVSINELNSILKNKWDLSELKTYSDVDIVFVAGIFLWYRQNIENWKKIPRLFYLTQNDNAWNHSHYFKQIEYLYETKHSDIFEAFPNATNSTANPVSKFFAPPIYIKNQKSINIFFGTETVNKRVNGLKGKYIDLFDVDDFVNKTSEKYKESKDDYVNYTSEVHEKLEKAPPIFVFIFIVTCKRLAKKENRIFEETTEYVEKIWQFTQTYTNGLHELARNIVEHSGSDGNEGEGMITIRAYSESETDKTKVLETHVFDYGKTGIIPRLKQYTDRGIVIDETGLSESQKKVNSAYKDDSKTLVNNFKLHHFIKDKTLRQQSFRHIAHYGINKLQRLVEEKPLKGEMYVASRGITGLLDHYGKNAENLTLTTGTHYYFRIPFIADNFRKIEISTYKRQEFSTLGSSDALQNLVKKKIEQLDIDSLNSCNGKLDEFDGILDIAVNKKIDKELVSNADKYFGRLTTLKKSIVVALNLEDSETDSESNLLRFLGYLTEEHKQSFVVYNLDFSVYQKMVEDNRIFAETRKWEAFWNPYRGMLVFTKISGRDFYFADILYGNTIENYYSVNKTLGNTFPNSALIINKEMENIEPDNNINLSDFFNNNALLPYDILLKNRGKELFLFNIETILKNSLFRDEFIAEEDRGTFSIEKVLKNYIDNFEGYRITNTHFKIGNKVHSADFYYAKRLFQNSFYTTRIAMHIAKQINAEIDDVQAEVTLAGYEMYSELILSLIKHFMIHIYGYKRDKLNHFVAKNENDKLVFLPPDSFKKYINECKKGKTIIVIPIAATGNTTKKIESEIKKTYNKKTSDEITKEDNLFIPYNIILSQDSNPDFDYIKNNDTKYPPIICLPAKWYKLENCMLCYGVDDKGNRVATKPLFDTDNSSLTPSLIFDNPEGQTGREKGEVKSSVKFDDLNFDDSIKYQSVARNDNYRIYDIDSDIFISKNKPEIITWLTETVKQELEKNCGLTTTARIVIVAPCHESNSQFLNLINENVFASAATIIHHQNSVDFIENFKLLNKNYLTGGNTQIFYVDDSLITGKHFFELYDLVKQVTETDTPFTGSILLNDQTVPFIHNRAVRWSSKYFAFAIYNQPSTLNMFHNHPLEHEHRRYESLQESALHDVIREHFYKKANKLVPQKRQDENTEPHEKQLRRLRMFEATHKIYDYFATHKEIPDQLEKIVDFKLQHNLTESDPKDEIDTNRKALFKVLSQFPFISYKGLRMKTFDWHKQLIGQLPIPNSNSFDIQKDYDQEFSTFKFRLRRASFLGNYQVLEIEFLRILLRWFQKIDLYFEKQSVEKAQLTPTDRQKEKNLYDFPIFVIGNYVEMIQKNAWIIHKLKENIHRDEDFLSQLKNSNQGRQFFNMLQIEVAFVIDDFMKMINKEYHIKWRDMYKDPTQANNEYELYDDTNKIEDFFRKKQELLKTNKHELVKTIFLGGIDILGKKEFINYLWIKQLLYADSVDKDSFIKIDYQKEINGIIGKMRGFFPEQEEDKKVRAFFIVTDGQQNPYVLSPQGNSILNEFTNEFKASKEGDQKNSAFKTKIIIDFLKGKQYKTSNVTETTAEFVLENKKGKNIYTNEEVTLEFMPPGYKWLYLIRITKLKTDKNGNCTFETQGLLGFYSKINRVDEMLPKQLLMLLRKDMSSFINKHHKNDEFSGLIQQREQNKYIFRLNHGVSDYEDAIENILAKCNDTVLKNELDTFFQYLILKLNLIDKLSSKATIEAVSLHSIKEEFEKKYKKVMALNVASVNGIKKGKIPSLVKLNNFQGIKNLDEKFIFPNGSMSDIIFELLNNIRKNVCSMATHLITPENPVVIDVSIINENGNKYLSITNNHVRNLDRPHSEEDIQHGLDLLRQMWHTHNLGEIITPDFPLKESSFTIKIHLKKFIMKKVIIIEDNQKEFQRIKSILRADFIECPQEYTDNDFDTGIPESFINKLKISLVSTFATKAGYEEKARLKMSLETELKGYIGENDMPVYLIDYKLDGGGRTNDINGINFIEEFLEKMYPESIIPVLFITGANNSARINVEEYVEKINDTTICDHQTKPNATEWQRVKSKILSFIKNAQVKPRSNEDTSSNIEDDYEDS